MEHLFLSETKASEDLALAKYGHERRVFGCVFSEGEQ